MKEFKSVFLATILLTAPLQANSAEQEPANLLENPGFEERKANQNAVAWSAKRHAGSTAYKFDLDTVVFFKGKQSYRIEQHADQDYGMVKQKVMLPNKKAERFTFSAMLKTQGIVDRIGWRLTVNCLAKSGRVLEQFQSEPLHGTNDWQKITLEEDLPKGTARIDVGIILQSIGTGWVDEAYLAVK
ncbi:MAG: hypothetical protein Hals2KO_28880 [Halioglobus sp.]